MEKKTETAMVWYFNTVHAQVSCNNIMSKTEERKGDKTARVIAKCLPYRID